MELIVLEILKEINPYWVGWEDALPRFRETDIL